MPAITDVTELQAMENDLAGDYWLANDIDASATSGWNGGLGFDPIGSLGTEFTGTFDGKEYTISSLYIDRPTESYVGLFGYVNLGLVWDVNLTNCDIEGKYYVGALAGFTNQAAHDTIVVQNCSASGEVKGKYRTGGLIGDNYLGKVYLCNSSVNVTSTAIGEYAAQFGGLIGINGNDWGDVIKCSATGNVTVNVPDDRVFSVGGLCGYHDGPMEECYSTGAIAVTTPAAKEIKEIGGLAGSTEGNGDIVDCYSRSNVTCSGSASQNKIGGLLGDTGDNVINSFSTGLVTATGADIGGLIGNFWGGSVTNSYWDTETSGQAASDGGTGKTTAEMKLIATYSGWDIIVHSTDLNNGYPYLGWQDTQGITWLIYSDDSPRLTVAIQEKITLESIRNIEMSARGRFRVSKDGDAVYRSRYARNV